MTKLGRIAKAIGRFFSNLPSLLLALAIYVVLSLFTYLVLVVRLPDEKRPGLATYLLATGGDPTPYLRDSSNLLLYGWVLLFHILSWLIVPVLAATAMDISFRAYDAHRRKATQRLRTKMVAILVDEAGLSTIAATERVQAEFSDWMDRASKH